MKKPQGIIFDMDNTVIRSLIDFPLMKSEVCRILSQAGIEPDVTAPVAKITALAKKDALMTDEIWDILWQRIAEIEYEGLTKAVLEPGIVPILEGLIPHAHLFMLTNNVYTDAEATIRRLEVRDYFDIMIGRGITPALKPSPDGILYILKKFSHLKAIDCMAIGDAIIDIQSAEAAGIEKFIAYNASHDEDWNRHSKKPLFYLKKWDQESLEFLLQTLKRGAFDG
ncbi:MAG: HAD family hydrolase [Bacillota bacterium]|jgi:phosphoglycolate phosphatase